MATQYIAKCGRGHVARGTSEDVKGGWLDCPCGSYGVAKPMKVTLNERTCGGVCTGATGPSCSCSCGGANHGAGLAFAN